MRPSFFNSVLRVNLSEGLIAAEPLGNVYLRRYMGGWNIIADTLLREVPVGADALGPENRLVFAPGVLTGLPVLGTSRNAVGAKSPLTGGFGASEAGGHWPAQLKRAGFDAIVFEGVSPAPVYLWIRDGQAELRDASHLWGRTTRETLETIREELGDRRICCALIGPGGENLVKYANVMNGLHDAAGRCGLGAVMGSKKLKAVAVRGTHRLRGLHIDQIGDLARRKWDALRQTEGLFKYGTGGDLSRLVESGFLPVRNFRDGLFADVSGISAPHYWKDMGIGKDGCYACPVRCKTLLEADEPYEVDPAYGGPEYESIAALGSNCGISDMRAVARASALCNAYSLDTIGVGENIAIAMECFEEGLLTERDTDGIELRFGKSDAMLQMVGKIAHREGFGDLLAEGPLDLARQIGGNAESFAMQVKNQAYPMHEPRYGRGRALGFSVSPTGADHIHTLRENELGLLSTDDDGFVPGAMRCLGVLEPTHMGSYGPEKVRAAAYYVNCVALMNCLVTCLFVDWTVEEEVDLVHAATGWDVGDFELLKVGERAYTLARLFSCREGLTSADDYLAERSYGPKTDGVLAAADAGIDREALRDAINMFYGMMGWDRKTGVPLPEKLHELGVSWAVEHLPE